jgi:hypothetical protein
MPTELTAIIETTNNTDKSHKERVQVEKLKIYHPRNPYEWRTSIFTRLHNFLRSIQQLQDGASSPPCVQGSHSALQRAILQYRQHTTILLPIQLYRALFYTKEPHSTLRHLFRHYCTPLHTAVPLLSFEGYRLILPWTKSCIWSMSLRWLFFPWRTNIIFNIFLNVIITTHSSPIPPAVNDTRNITINSTHLSVSLRCQVKMNCYDSSMPLVYEMAIPDLQALHHYSTIPPNPKMPSTVTLKAVLDETLCNCMVDHMIPIFNTEERRGKRSIKYIADFYSWSCGQAKQSDVDQLYVHEMDSLASAMKSQINRDHSFLVNQYKIDNDFQNKVERALNFTAMSVSNVSNLLVRNEQGMESQIQSEALGMIQVTVTRHAVTSTSAWLKTLSDCHNKLIPRKPIPNACHSIHFHSPHLAPSDLSYLCK